MGCWYSRLIEREEKVSRCKARMRYMKQVVKARHSFAAAHVMYVRSLRSIGAALLQFATAENGLHRRHLPPPPSSPPRPPRRTNPPPPPHPRPPMSPTSWTTTSTATSSAIHPPPPPPAAGTSAWDFWDPFMPTAGRSVDEEEWEEEATTTSASEAAATTVAGTQPPSVATATSTSNTTTGSELAVVVSTKSKDLAEIIQELDDYFLQAANSGRPLSSLLEVPTGSFHSQTTSGKDYGHGKSLNPLMWTWGSSSAKWNTFGKFCEDPFEKQLGPLNGNTSFNHCSTVERLYTWEKKLYQEVKNAEFLKLEHEKKVAALRKLELKNADYIKTEKAKKEAEKFESQMLVASQAIETISAEIIKLRESMLYPQLLELIQGLTNMWRSMYEFHQVQTHIVQQLKYLDCIPSTEPTSEIHRQSTLQLELEAQQWHISFCNLMKAHRDYVQSLTGWLRLSLFQVGNNPVHKTGQDSAVYSLCEEWQLAINNAPDKVASEGIKSFLSMIHAIVVQQADEQKQKKRSESAYKELEKKAAELRSLENKLGPYSTLESSTTKNPIREKRAKMEMVRSKAQDEQAKHEKAVGVTRAMTMNNLQMGLPHIFQALTGFANVCKQGFESVQNQAKSTGDLHNVKLLMP
ncbi:protein ALTERED PHOSPHATE STARVATION RESPONSE 1-like [Andrographis paniculata]|uniref:protein ALTERED PHOSPHATE STARVATION RESPONSE 1-like n=1 Tax=Andrographis paniculata TaxID=175694 RepID=UPI0021E77EFC|nr:protein ALTERED PHOSPHATE STARVATION RESPONSE 1-like [Andrographis paniculata]